MNEGRIFVVETVETMGRLIHVCIILRHKLPSHFRWDDIITTRVTVGRSGIRHNGGRVCYGGQTKEDIQGKSHTDECKKQGQRRKREEI